MHLADSYRERKERFGQVKPSQKSEKTGARLSAAHAPHTHNSRRKGWNAKKVYKVTVIFLQIPFNVPVAVLLQLPLPSRFTYLFYVRRTKMVSLYILVCCWRKLARGSLPNTIWMKLWLCKLNYVVVSRRNVVVAADLVVLYHKTPFFQ